MASKAEIEMLRAGAQKIAAAMELGLSEGELMDLLSRQSKQSAGIVARGRDDSGSFRFSPAFGSGEFKRQGKQLRLIGSSVQIQTLMLSRKLLLFLYKILHQNFDQQLIIQLCLSL